MSKKIRAFIGYLKVLVNGETLGGGFYRFLSVHACFLVFYGLPHVFINTMLLGQTGDVKVVVMYNATFFLGSAAAMLLAGFIIDAVGGTRGYMAVFGLSFAVSAVTCALALRLPKRRMAGAHKVDYPRTLRAIGRNRHLLYSLAAQGCKGVREGAFTFILSIVLYQMVKNELLVGFNTFLSAAAAIASYVIASRILSLANRVRYMGIAVAVLTGIAALCILHLSPMTVILYTVVNSFFAGFLENSTYSTFLDMMQLVPEMDDHRPELLAVNDTVLELGRCVGLSIIIVMNVYVGEDVGVQVWSLLVLTLTQVGTVLLCRGAMRSAKQAAPGA